MAHGDAGERRWRMEWVASIFHTTSKHDVSSITTADPHTSAASSWLNGRSSRFKWTSPFRRKTKSGICARAITFQLASTNGSQFLFKFFTPSYFQFSGFWGNSKFGKLFFPSRTGLNAEYEWWVITWEVSEWRWWMWHWSTFTVLRQDGSCPLHTNSVV